MFGGAYVGGKDHCKTAQMWPVGLIHASGMKTVNIMHEALRKACMTRPSDAAWGKPHDGTATDWVTRGHLTPSMRDMVA